MIKITSDAVINETYWTFALQSLLELQCVASNAGTLQGKIVLRITDTSSPIINKNFQYTRRTVGKTQFPQSDLFIFRHHVHVSAKGM